MRHGVASPGRFALGSRSRNRTTGRCGPRTQAVTNKTSVDFTSITSLFVCLPLFVHLARNDLIFTPYSYLLRSWCGDVDNSGGLFLLQIHDESSLEILALLQYVHFVPPARKREKHTVFVVHLEKVRQSLVACYLACDTICLKYNDQV